MGLIGMLVVTTAPAGTTAGTAYPAATTTAGTVPAVTYNAELPLEFSEIDPVQNNGRRCRGKDPRLQRNECKKVGGGAWSDHGHERRNRLYFKSSRHH